MVIKTDAGTEYRTDFDAIPEVEEKYLDTSKRLLGMSLKLVDDLLGVLDSLKKHSNEAPDAECSLVPIPLLDLVRYQFAMAVLACLRGHISTSLVFARSMVEACGHAVRLVEELTLIDLWFANSKCEKADPKYIEAFKTRKLFPPEDTTRSLLHKRYALFSLRTHPSAQVLKSHLISEGEAFIFDYNDARTSADVVQGYALLVDTVVLCIRVLRAAWGTRLNTNGLGSWDADWHLVQERIGRHMARLKELSEMPTSLVGGAYGDQ